MKLYNIQMNGQTLGVRAGSAAVALKRAADQFKETELIRASFIIVSSRKIEYQYCLIAEVPCDPPGSRKKAIVSDVLETENEAHMIIDGVREAHPEYNYVRVQKVEKQ